MLIAKTLEIIQRLTDLGITRISTKEDPSPVHGNKEKEFIIKVQETVYHGTLLRVISLIQQYSSVRVNATEDDGLEIYEVEED